MSAPGRARKVTLYSRPGCHLCDEAGAVLERVRRRIRFELEEVNITGDRTLEIAYGREIPVVAVDGVPRWRGRVDEAALLAELE